MRIVLQRVTEASVKIENEVKGQIDHGFLILVGIENEDEKSDADWLIQKINGLRDKEILLFSNWIIIPSINVFRKSVSCMGPIVMG